MREINLAIDSEALLGGLCARTNRSDAFSRQDPAAGHVGWKCPFQVFKQLQAAGFQPVVGVVRKEMG